MKKNILLAALILTPTLALADNNETLVVSFQIKDNIHGVIDTFRDIVITQERLTGKRLSTKLYTTSFVEDFYSKKILMISWLQTPP